MQKSKNVKVSDETIAKIGQRMSQDGLLGHGDLTPKENCQLLHNGECGECADNGDFAPCA